MTQTQRLQVEQSELREHVNRILGIAVEERSDEDKAKLTASTDRLLALEPELRAAIIASPEESRETTETRQTDTKDDKEARELKELGSKVKIGDHVAAALELRALDGAALEYNQALGLNRAGAFPLELLAPQVEERATTDTDISRTPRRWLDRLFADTAAMRLGITFESVPAGIPSFPITSAGGAPAQRGRGQAAGNAPWTVGVSELKPTRNTVRATFSEEDVLRLPGLEEALRRDLGMAMTERIDRIVFTGDTGANENRADIAGLDTRADLVDRTITQANKIKGDGVLSAFAGLIDGIHATRTSDLRVVLTVGAYRLWVHTLANTGASVDTTIMEFLRRAGLSSSARGQIETSTNADKWGAFVGRGRGISGSGVAAVWNSGLLIRDPYTEAAKGEVALTLSYFWNFGLPRPTSFARVKFVA